MPRFQKGQSGNPAGRPKGIANPQARLRKSIEKDLPDIIATTVDLAKGGDTAAIKLLMDRVLPALRPVDTPVNLTLGETLTGSGKAVLNATGTGHVTPDQAAKLLGGIGTLARVIEVDELVKRLDMLEERVNGGQATN